MIAFRLLTISVRNLARNRRRTLFTCFAVTLGVAMLIFLDSVNGGIAATLMDRLIHSQVGDIGIYRKDYNRLAKAGRLVHLTVPYNKEMTDKIANVSDVIAVTGRIIFQSTITSGVAETLSVITAIDPRYETEVLPFHKFSLEKDTEPLNIDDLPGAILLNSDIAQALHAESAPITLLATNRFGASSSIDLEKRGFTPTTFGMKNNFLALSAAQDLLGLSGQATELIARVKSQTNLEQAAQSLREALGNDFEVLTWKQILPEAEDENRRQATMSRTVSFLLMLLVIFGITNTMMMCVQERQGEIGTLMALGMEPFYIFILFAEEAVIVGLVGGILGAAFGITGALIANRLGIPLGSTSPIFIDGLRPVFNWSYVGMTLVFVVTAAFVGGLIPAIQAARKLPVEGLAHNI